MNPPVLIDTSCWVEYFNRPDSKTAGRVRRIIGEDRAAITGIVLAELLQGTRTSREASELRAALDALLWLETGKDVFVRAGALGFESRRRGVTVPLTDCLITAAAESGETSILTLDSHFEQLAHVSSVTLEEV